MIFWNTSIFSCRWAIVDPVGATIATTIVAVATTRLFLCFVFGLLRSIRWFFIINFFIRFRCYSRWFFRFWFIIFILIVIRIENFSFTLFRWRRCCCRYGFVMTIFFLASGTWFNFGPGTGFNFGLRWFFFAICLFLRIVNVVLL